MPSSLSVDQCRLLRLCCDEAEAAGADRAVDVRDLLKRSVAENRSQQMVDTLSMLIRL
jgi:hypothetical protein